ncbi:MAG: AAA family ATPase [Clostridia bacterium]|nr:AAA family ATPase [Clostridia bacterium]
MISDLELKKERDYLKTVLYILQKKIAGNEEMLTDIEKKISEDLRYAWDNRMDDYEWAEVKLSVNRREATSVNAKNRLFAYHRMLKSAYFARIDFDDGTEVVPIYLGIATLDDGNYFYVYDWRSPISSMFYDFELGKAYYDTPNGRIEGNIVLKRQYKLDGENIVQVFDTSLQVIDNVLQGILEGHASTKMRNIVMTIQKEQNKIIRRLDSDVMVVSGPAGSGKTSVALHRVAFLLYAYKESLKNSNVLILSPNDIFSNYISEVLPEIGEDNVYQTTFADFVAAFLTEFKVKGNLSDLYETIYLTNGVEKEDVVAKNSIRLKQSSVFIRLLEKYIEKRKHKMLSVEDVVVDGNTIIGKEFLAKFASTIDQSGLTLKEQGQQIIEKVLIHLSIKLGEKTSAISKIKKTLEMTLSKLKPREFYVELFDDRNKFVEMVEEVYNELGTNKAQRLSIKELSDIFAYTQDNLSRNLLPFEDVSGYLYLKDRLVGIKTQQNIKQVVIDEGQDYSVMQYRILSHVFKNAKITVLGDENQSILPYASRLNFEQLTNVLMENRVKSKCSTNYLSKTYRSTVEINSFTKKIIGETNLYNQVERHGDEVEIVKDTKKFYGSTLFNDAIKLKTKDNTLAIITKTEADAERLKNELDGTKEAKKFKVVARTDKTFAGDKILIIPAYLAKGLEFDVALVCGAEEDEYLPEFKNLFYVACTRALHKLKVYYTDKLTSLIEK